MSECDFSTADGFVVCRHTCMPRLRAHRKGKYREVLQLGKPQKRTVFFLRDGTTDVLPLNEPTSGRKMQVPTRTRLVRVLQLSRSRSFGSVTLHPETLGITGTFGGRRCVCSWYAGGQKKRCRSYDYDGCLAVVSHETGRWHQRPAGNNRQFQRRHPDRSIVFLPGVINLIFTHVAQSRHVLFSAKQHVHIMYVFMIALKTLN